MASEPGHPDRPSAMIAILVVPVLVAIALATFAWPASNLEPRDLPFGIAGPAQADAPFQERLETSEGAFDLLGRPGVGAIGILAAVAALSGLVTIAMVQGWLGILEGPWLLNAVVVSLGVLAIASVVAGLAALIGPAGIGVAARLMVFVGNP